MRRKVYSFQEPPENDSEEVKPKKKKKLPIINESPASDDEFKDKENLLEN